MFDILSHRLLGTPSEKQWPGVSSLRDWHVYPQWEPQNLTRAVPSLEPEGVDLLSVMLLCSFYFISFKRIFYIAQIDKIVSVREPTLSGKLLIPAKKKKKNCCRFLGTD